MKKIRQEILDFLYNDIKKNKGTSNMDDFSDVRFARFINEKVKFYITGNQCGSKIRYYTDEKITQKRLRYIRILIKQGKIKASWGGLWQGCSNDLFGIRRVRHYDLPE